MYIQTYCCIRWHGGRGTLASYIGTLVFEGLLRKNYYICNWLGFPAFFILLAATIFLFSIFMSFPPYEYIGPYFGPSRLTDRSRWCNCNIRTSDTGILGWIPSVGIDCHVVFVDVQFCVCMSIISVMVEKGDFKGMHAFKEPGSFLVLSLRSNISSLRTSCIMCITLSLS